MTSSLRKPHLAVGFDLFDAVFRHLHQLLHHLEDAVFPYEGSQFVARAVEGADEVVAATVDHVLAQAVLPFRPLVARFAVCVNHERSLELVPMVLELHERAFRRGVCDRSSKFWW